MKLLICRNLAEILLMWPISRIDIFTHNIIKLAIIKIQLPMQYEIREIWFFPLPEQDLPLPIELDRYVIHYLPYILCRQIIQFFAQKVVEFAQKFNNFFLIVVIDVALLEDLRNFINVIEMLLSLLFFKLNCCFRHWDAQSRWLRFQICLLV